MVDLLADPALVSQNVHTKSGRDVLKRDSIRFEERDFLIVIPSPHLTGDDSAELGNGFPTDHSPLDGRQQVSCLDLRLIYGVDRNHGSPFDGSNIDLALYRDI